jgi:hypothetical protein
LSFTGSEARCRAVALGKTQVTDQLEIAKLT